jgi:hypothetical protein
MFYRWKLRREFFKGPGIYPIDIKSGEATKTIRLEVDNLGHFQIEATSDFPVQTYAEPIG